MTPKQMARRRWDKPGARETKAAQTRAQWADIPAYERSARMRAVRAKTKDKS